MATVKLSSRNHWFSTFLINCYNLIRNHGRNNKLWNIVSTEKYMLYMQVMLECCYIDVNRSLTIVKFNASLLSQRFILNRLLLSMYRSRSKYEAHHTCGTCIYLYSRFNIYRIFSETIILFIQLLITSFSENRL